MTSISVNFTILMCGMSTYFSVQCRFFFLSLARLSRNSFQTTDNYLEALGQLVAHMLVNVLLAEYIVQRIILI